MIVGTGTDALLTRARRGHARVARIDDGSAAGVGDQHVDAQSIVEAEAGLARGLCYGVLFALPLWMAIAGIAVMLAA